MLPIVRLNVEFLKRNRDKYEGTVEFWDVLNNFGRDDTPEKDFPVEYQFKTTPMPHQLECIKKMYPLKIGAAFMDIGTGKSKVAVDIASCRYYASSINRVLVIALFSIKDNWVNEVNIHSPLNCDTHVLETSNSGKKKYNEWLKDEGGFKWLIVGVESFSNGAAFDMCLDFVDSDTMIVVDESDSIKTYNAIRTERCISLGQVVKYKMIMTGTPLEKGIIDLYSQFQFLDPDIIGIGDYYSFKNRFAIMGGHKNKNIIGYQRVEELVGDVGDYIFQVRKRDVLTNLPESTYQERVVQMSAEQRKLYMELKSKLKLECDGNKLTVSSTINLMQRFSEITGGFYSYADEEQAQEIKIGEKIKIKYKKEYLQSNPKAKELMELLEKLPDDESVVIWAVNKMEVAYLVSIVSDRYGESQVVQMHGEVSREDRTIGLDKFQSGRAKYLIGNQAVGGVGLNMTRASIMVYFSNDFSYRRRIQSEGRIERMGQIRPMLYIDIVCAGSIDKYIVKALKDKEDFSEAIRSSFDNNRLEDIL
jgi:SNF2 family DNA or RNA helicase